MEGKEYEKIKITNSPLPRDGNYLMYTSHTNVNVSSPPSVTGAYTNKIGVLVHFCMTLIFNDFCLLLLTNL